MRKFNSEPHRYLNKVLKETTKKAIGEVIEVKETKGLLVACKSGAVLRVDIVQSAEGIMIANRFVRMAGIKIGEYFS